MAVKLTIRRPDSTIYWVERFRTRAEADKWVAEEQTRPYWNKAFTLTFVDIPDGPGIPQPTPEEQAKIAAQLAAAVRLRTANVDGAATLADLRAILRDIVIAAGFR